MEDSNGTASAVVTNDMLNLWGITQEQLHDDTVATENTRNPVCFYTMDDVMSEMMLSAKPTNLFNRPELVETGAVPMYVLTSQSKMDGAGVLARDGVLEKIGELIGSNFYVLPSSIHEVLIVPDNGNMQAKELEDINMGRLPHNRKRLWKHWGLNCRNRRIQSEEKTTAR